jgi:DNA-binding beta-propeller fold protein YncE
MPLDTLPMSSALSPDGRFLLVLNGGYNPPSISVIGVRETRELARVRLPDAWLGICFSPKGDKVYVGGGSTASIHEMNFSNGALTLARSFPVAPAQKKTERDFIGDVTLSPDGRLLYASDLYHDSVAVVNPQSGVVIERFKTGRRPYRILFHPDGKSFFVTSWSDGTLGHYNVADGSLLSSLRLGAHPTDMVWREGKNDPAEGESGWAARLFVTAANTNNVYTVGVSESKDLKVVEIINAAMTPRQPVGMTPSALALSPDRNRLYIVCSDANAAAVADVSQDRSRVLGFIPTGWYPTAARVVPDGRLVVLNGRGLRSHANPKGPDPTKKAAPLHEGIRSDEYVGSIQRGSASWIDPASDAQIAAYTKTVLANSPYNDAKLDRREPLPEGIRHVIYIVKENRTYDQVFGDMKEGNGDAKLLLFGEEITPNHHKLAREFVLFDNFYVSADVSADGHNWSTAAIASDYIQRLWPNSYAGRRQFYDYEGQEPTAAPPAGYLWTNAAAAGVSLRNYGYFVDNVPNPKPGAIAISGTRDPVLQRVTNPRFPGFDLDYPDIERAKVFLEDFASFEKSGELPALSLVRLGNDHTSGTAPGKIAPLSAVADNDYALGMIVESVSRSRFWTSTAIFVLEDDAQNGADHVDSHRSPAFVISAFSKRKFVDSTMYNTTSMLRTMEIILGLRPMTHFDAGARVMTAAFQSAPDPAPYTAEKPRIPLDRRNPAVSATSARSARMNFAREDAIDDDELNDILWRAIRKDEPPAPVRSVFGQ